MKYDNDIAPQMIKCPSCGTVQAAIVEFTLPWQTFIHECVKCKYTIMESEWEEVKPFTKYMSHWIRIEDKMPNYDEFVLWYHINGNMFVHELDKDGNGFLKYVTHWQALPEPPITSKNAILI